jgi:DNA polymerase-3 subunit epsilon
VAAWFFAPAGEKPDSDLQQLRAEIRELRRAIKIAMARASDGGAGKRELQSRVGGGPIRTTRRRRRGHGMARGSKGSVVLGETPFAVVDVEATGIYPGGHDRIVEVAVVRTTPGCEVVEEWTTLVNPGRDIGRTDIHGIRAGDVTHAPVFEEIAADLGARLQGTVVASHNLRFDLGFLGAEYRRCAIRFPEIPGLCTLALAYKLLPDSPSRKLEYCCEQAGILYADEHTALGDARATACLLAEFLRRAKGLGLDTLDELGCAPLESPGGDWLLGVAATGKHLAREAARKRRAEERSYLARLVHGMLGDEAKTAREGEYLGLVDRALQDRRVSTEEAMLLRDMAQSWGMSREEVLRAHRAYLAGLASEALADGHVSEAERRDLDEVCDMLGLHRMVLDVLLTEAPAHSERRASPVILPGSGNDLKGKSVCFTGELVGTYRRERITREVAEQLATQAGVEVRPSVTKVLDVLVVADPDTQSTKARKARQYGVRIMSASAFWKAIGIKVD